MRWARLGARSIQPEQVLREHLLTKESEMLHPGDVLRAGRLSETTGMSWILCSLLPGAEQVNKGSSGRFPNPPPSAGKLIFQLFSQN